MLDQLVSLLLVFALCGGVFAIGGLITDYKRYQRRERMRRGEARWSWRD